MGIEIIREQFNKQAEKYSEWSVTKNIEYLHKYYEFCNISVDDVLLDVACGCGDFLIAEAPKIKWAYGVDLSDRLIEMAKKESTACGFENIHFECGDFGSLSLSDKYSVVVCRMAFHHFKSYKSIFNKINEICLPYGKIGIQDIVAYEDKSVQNFFEVFEKEVDNSHNRSLTKDEFVGMYNDNGIRIVKTMELDREICVNEYISHAVQSKANFKKINDLIRSGLNDSRISQYLFSKGEDVFFKRKIFLILGEKIKNGG